MRIVEYSAGGAFCRIKIYGRKKSPCRFPKVILQKREFVVDYSAGVRKKYSKEDLGVGAAGKDGYKRNQPPP